jgi:hypothetical protein
MALIDVKDRVSTYPGRVKLTRADGTSEYVTLQRADVPSQEGTPLNKVLFDSINDDLEGKVSRLGDTMNGNLTIQNTAPSVELFDPEYDGRTRLYKDVSSNADYGTMISDIDATDNIDSLNLRRSAALLDKLSLYVENANGTSTRYAIYGAHTKPWGNYTGNGATAVRQVNTTGNGYACIVHSGSGTCIVMARGAIRVGGGAFSWLPSGQAYFKNGILYIASTDSTLNTSGTIYSYEVL